MFEQIGEGHKIMADGPKPEPDIDELERQIGRRTQLCWRAGGTDPWYKLVMQDDPERGRGRNIAKCFSEADAAYIVDVCNAVPGLIAENRALRERVRELEKRNESLIEENHTLYSRWETCLQDYRRLENKAAKEIKQ